jgi:hypothetical protein
MNEKIMSSTTLDTTFNIRLSNLYTGMYNHPHEFYMFEKSLFMIGTREMALH